MFSEDLNLPPFTGMSAFKVLPPVDFWWRIVNVWIESVHPAGSVTSPDTVMVPDPADTVMLIFGCGGGGVWASEGLPTMAKAIRTGMKNRMAPSELGGLK